MIRKIFAVFTLTALLGLSPFQYSGAEENPLYLGSDNIYYKCPDGKTMAAPADLSIDLVSASMIDKAYFKDKSKVYKVSEDSHSGICSFGIVKDADPVTFKVLNDYFQKDKNNAYFNSYYWGFGIPQKIENADANTFEIVNKKYAKDYKKVYYANVTNLVIVESADAQSFSNTASANDPDYAVDKNYLYYQGKIKTQTKAKAGSLIKMEGLSSVYYLGQDGKRYVFPNATTYFSWYPDFTEVVTITKEELESYPLGANITIRPGTKLVKITTNPKVYAVVDNDLMEIPDETTAKNLYGDNWAKRVVDVPDAFFVNYKILNERVSASAYPEGSLIKKPGSDNIYYVRSDGVRKFFSLSVFKANRFKEEDVIAMNNSFTLPKEVTGINSAESGLTDTSGGACCGL